MAKAFASQGDLEVKEITWTQLSENAYAYTAEGDPNSGVIIGDDGVLIIDTTGTPAMAQQLIAKIRSVTDKPIKYVVLSHYHAVRVLGASAYFKEGAQEIIASRGTYELIVERGEADMKSEIERDLGQPVVLPARQNTAVHPEFDTPIGVHADLDISINQLAVLRRVVQQVHDLVVLHRQRLRHLARFAPGEHPIEPALLRLYRLRLFGHALATQAASFISRS
ncbi:hypothetical protein OKW28_007078 [Paraburkholderia sp. 40]